MPTSKTIIKGDIKAEVIYGNYKLQIIFNKKYIQNEFFFSFFKVD